MPLLNSETSKEGKIISYVMFTGAVSFDGSYLMFLAFVSQDIWHFAESYTKILSFFFYGSNYSHVYVLEAGMNLG